VLAVHPAVRLGGECSVSEVSSRSVFLVARSLLVVGIVLTALVLALINSIGALAPLRGLTGLILVVGVLASLVATLSREAFSPRR
jgi:hypothetical protein